MVVGKSGNDPGAQFNGFRMRQFQRGRLFQMVVQQPRDG